MNHHLLVSLHILGIFLTLVSIGSSFRGQQKWTTISFLLGLGICFITGVLFFAQFTSSTQKYPDWALAKFALLFSSSVSFFWGAKKHRFFLWLTALLLFAAMIITVYKPDRSSSKLVPLPNLTPGTSAKPAGPMPPPAALGPDGKPWKPAK